MPSKRREARTPAQPLTSACLRTRATCETTGGASRSRETPRPPINSLLPQSSGMSPRRHRKHEMTPRLPLRRKERGSSPFHSWIQRCLPARTFSPRTRPQNKRRLKWKSQHAKNANASVGENFSPEASRRQTIDKLRNNTRTRMSSTRRSSIENQQVSVRGSLREADRVGLGLRFRHATATHHLGSRSKVVDRRVQRAQGSRRRQTKARKDATNSGTDEASAFPHARKGSQRPSAPLIER